MSTNGAGISCSSSIPPLPNSLPTITSTANPFVKRARRLRNRKFREAEGVFLVEGIAHVRQAIDHAAPLESLIVAPELLRSEGAWSAVAEREGAGVEVVRLGREAFESIVERDHPSGLAATVRISQTQPTDLVAGPGSIFVAVQDVGNPGNLGSIIRTVDAVGGAGVLVLGDATDHLHPAAVKASMGTLFRVQVVRAAGVDELIAWCLMEAVDVVTTSAKADLLLWDAEIPTPVCFLFGSETQGLAPEVLARGRYAVRLPMEGSASSLNLAVSVGVILYEMRRRLRA